MNCGVNEHMSFLEMLDVLNEELFMRASLLHLDLIVVRVFAGNVVLLLTVMHDPERTTTCQLHMRHFKDGDCITIEPWRAKGFPIIRT